MSAKSLTESLFHHLFAVDVGRLFVYRDANSTQFASIPFCCFAGSLHIVHPPLLFDESVFKKDETVELFNCVYISYESVPVASTSLNPLDAE